MAPRAASGQRGHASTNVRELPSSFVGRSAHLSAIQARFDEGARLVTIVAAGGMGKTRVATRFAALHGAAYSAHGGGGAWVCDLTDASDADGLCGVVAGTLGLASTRTGSEPAFEALGRAIARKKRVLLVLDNVEHIAVDAAQVVRAWMTMAPHARLLATSRIVLGVPGEHLLPLTPLELPATAMAPHDIAGTESVELFLRRAREVRPGFQPTPEQLGVLAAVVRATDGIPLAIELAAARVAVLTLDQLEDRLSAPLDLLVRGHAGGRHGSMRRTLVDSFAMLDTAQRRCLASASVFRGGFTLDAAERVLDSSERPVLTTLEELVARSLVRTTEGPDGIRFSLYEMVRELAAEELAALPSISSRVTERHMRHFVELAAAVGGEATAGEAVAARARLSQELDNLLAAHAAAIAQAERMPVGQGGASAVAIAVALAPVLTRRGQLQRCLQLLDRAIGAAGHGRGRSQVVGFAEALVARGIAWRELGDVVRAKEDLAAGRALAEQAGDRALEALICVRWGEIVEALGETGEAREHFARGLERLAGAPEGRARTVREAELHARLGHAHRREGDLDAAERETNRALSLYRAADCEDELPLVLYEAGVIDLFRQRRGEAHAHFGEAMQLAERLGHRQAEAALASALGTLVQEEGRMDEALAHHAKAVRLFHETGSRHREGSALYYLGGAFLERGSLADAVKILSRAFEIMCAAGVPRYQALIAGRMATAAAEAADTDGARHWMERARRAAQACASEAAVQATLAIQEAHVALSRASSPERRRLVEHACSMAGDRASDDVRFALRLLSERARPEARAPATALVVLAEGRGFRLPGASLPVDISRRAPLRRILLALAALRADAPGAPLSMDEIIRAGWPGERIGADAAVNRVRVALATLRRLGLRDTIETGQGGYLLDPAIAVVIDDGQQDSELDTPAAGGVDGGS